MSNPRNAFRSLLRRLGVAGPARVRAFQGIGAGGWALNRGRARRHVPAAFLGLLAACAVLAGALALAAVPAGATTTHYPLSFQITGVPEDYALEDSGDLWLTGHINGSATFAVERFDATTGAFVSEPRTVQEPNRYEAIAIGHPAGGEAEMYVAESAGVALFSEAGVSLGAPWTGAATPATSFSVSGIAVDGSPLSWAAGDVYVADQSNKVVDVFRPEVDHGEHYVTQLTGTGASPTSPTPSEPFANPEAVAVNDVNGDVIVEDNRTLDLFEPTGFGEYAFVRTLTPPSGATFATGSENFQKGVLSADDGEGNIYIAGAVAGGREGRVFEYDATGEYIGYVAVNNIDAVASDPETHGLFVSRSDGEVVQAYGPSITIPDVTSSAVSSLTVKSAVLNGTVNPDGQGEAKCWFVWGTTPEFGNRAPCEPEGVAEGSAPVPVHAMVKLHGDTTYYYRLQASNQPKGVNPGGTNFGEPGQDQQFKTPGPGVGEAWSIDVRSTSVTLDAEINPDGAATTYFFQYGLTTAYEEGDVPASPGAPLGSGEASVQVEHHLQGLAAGQTYHYRVVALSEVAGEPVSEESADHTFTTQTGGEGGLPDGREWELVSPPDKHGALLEKAGSGNFIQAAPGGDRIEYGSNGVTEGEPAGNGDFIQVLARRTGAGWSNLDLATPHIFPGGGSGYVPYTMFSSDLSLAVLQPRGSFEPALSKEATEQTPYLRHNDECAPTPTEAIPTTCYQPLVTRADDTTNPFIPFGEENGEGYCPIGRCGPIFKGGASPDLSHIVLNQGENERSVPLLQGVPADSLYEWAGGKLALVSVPPEKNPPPNGIVDPALPGEHAVSNDGSRVFWGARETHEPNHGFLFVRDMTRKETIEIGGEDAGFEGANTEGSLVFYSGRECEVLVGGAGLECRPVLGEGGKPLEDGTVLSTSEDGSWVYFREGNSIYVRHGSEAAVLVASNIGTIGTQDEAGPQGDPWRASPNGEWFAFMSDSPLTGYDNRDAVTGQSDEEVYLYSASAKRLVCASCDPTGARPRGSTTLLGAVYGTGWETTPIAANIPSWTSYSAEKAIYDPRFLSNSGRLFFNAVGGLVPRDVNGQVDVYELEPPGEGSCTTATHTGTVLYVPAAAGCVALISSGESPEESEFEEASETGGDVFFMSSSRLSTADLDGSISMWDAHECTAASPCPPAPASAPPPCTTEASCKASPSPQPAIYGEGPSETFNGPGNVAPAPTVTKKVTKKAVKCKQHFVKDKKGKCIKKAKRKSKKAKKTNRGAKS